MTQQERTLYIGTFVHCASLTELDVCVNGVIGVDESGKIAFISRDSEEEGEQTPTPEGWEQAKTVRINGSGQGFFFPGFIGKIPPFP